MRSFSPAAWLCVGAFWRHLNVCVVYKVWLKSADNIPKICMAPGGDAMDRFRDAAERRLARLPRGQGSGLSAEELLHELHVSQIELEMQNEALREAQVALEESRDRYADLFEFAPVGYLTLSPSACVTAINLTGASLLGGERRSLQNRHFGRFVTPEDGDRWHRFFLESLRQPERLSCELSLLRGDGTRFDARLDCRRHAAPVAGDPELCLTLTDITQLRAAEQAERAKCALFDSPHQFICLLSREGRLIEANATALDFGDLAAEQVAGMPLWHTPWWSASSRSREALTAAIRKAADGLPVRFPAEWAGAQGQIAFVDVALRPVRDALGEVLHLILEAKNVTGRTQAEAAYQEQRALLEGFFRAAPVGLVVHDRDMRYVSINDALATMNGLPAEAHLGKTPGDTVPELAPSILALFEEVVERNTAVLDRPVSSSHPGVPGRIQHRRTSMFPIPGMDGKRRLFGGVVVNVTERVEAEAALAAKTRELKEAQRLARVGSWEWQPESDTLLWSPEVFRFTGLPPGLPAPRGKAQAALYRPEGWRQLREGFKRIEAAL